LLFLSSTLLAATAAAVPPLINHQGLLLAGQGAPRDGLVQLQLEIHDVAEGESRLWSESYQVQLVDGYYTLRLGGQSDLTGLFEGPGDRYLAVIVDGAEMSPRHRLVAVPYALTADNATGDITPNSVSVGGREVIDSEGRWVGLEPIGGGGGDGYSTPEEVLGALRSVDGDTSGLDADQLDGHEAADFVQGADQILLLLKDVDGPGSGLNADRLDGVDSSSFLQHGDDLVAALAPVDGTGSGLDADQLDGLEAGAFFQPGAPGAAGLIVGLVLSGDGAGSGLDADRLDSLDSTQFLRADQDTATTGSLAASSFDVRSAEMGGTRRDWMTDGLRVGAGGSDGAYFGMLDEGNNAADTIVAWGDDVGDDLRFTFARSGGAPGGEEYMRITSDGNVGVGTTSPGHRLDVNGRIGADSLQLDPLPNPPGDPDTGTVYLDANTMNLRVYNGEEWVDLTGGGGGGDDPSAAFKMAYGVWTDLNNGQDGVSRLPIFLAYTKQDSSSLLRLTLSSNLRTNGAGNTCCQWAIRVNGSNCSPAVNGSAYISPGGNYHHHRTITGICEDVPAGLVFIEPWVENCPGYGAGDCYTGWNSMTALIAEEIPADENMAYGGWGPLGLGHDATQALPISVTLDKEEADSLVEVWFTSNLRTNGASNECCRWNLRMNNETCNPAINGNVYISPGGNYHQVRTIVGLCPNVPAGPVTVTPWVEQCPGYGVDDCYTAWNSSTWLIVRERQPTDRIAYGVWENANDGSNATTALPYTVDYVKQETTTPLRLTLSGNLRTNGASNECCRWALRVNGNNCSPAVNGNVYISPGGNYHHHRTITGICDGISAGPITVQPYVEQCPGYGVDDCYTGWNSSMFLIVEEGPFGE